MGGVTGREGTGERRSIRNGPAEADRDTADGNPQLLNAASTPKQSGFATSVRQPALCHPQPDLLTQLFLLEAQMNLLK